MTGTEAFPVVDSSTEDKEGLQIVRLEETSVNCQLTTLFTIKDNVKLFFNTVLV